MVNKMGMENCPSDILLQLESTTSSCTVFLRSGLSSLRSRLHLLGPRCNDLLLLVILSPSQAPFSPEPSHLHPPTCYLTSWRSRHLRDPPSKTASICPSPVTLYCKYNYLCVVCLPLEDKFQRRQGFHLLLTVSYIACIKNPLPTLTLG